MSEKPDALVTENVFLDTCIFVAENYNSTAYQTLIRLGTMGAVKLKTTDITLKEIRQQITEKVGDATKSMQAKAGKSAILRNFDGYSELMEKFGVQKSEALAEELWVRVEKELTDAGVEIISATVMPPGPVFESYFAEKPPFGPGEKKKEFPDAFVIAALEAWCENEGADLHVISADH